MGLARIAAMAGDGIGSEVLPEGLRVVCAAADVFGFDLDIVPFDWPSCTCYASHGCPLLGATMKPKQAESSSPPSRLRSAQAL